MIKKGIILFWIQHLQQSRRWITTEISSDFVHFINHKNWIVGTGAPQPLNNFTRHGPDIGSPVPSDFSLIMNAAQRDSDKLPAQSSGD